MPGIAKLRRPGVVLLTTLGCLLSVLSLMTVWGRNQILETDRYLASVSPLASDPVIQDDVARKVSTAISSRLDAAALAEEALPPTAAFLAAPLGDAVDDFVRRETVEFVRSDAFAALWTELNRAGHVELVRLLNGEESQAVVIDEGRLGLDLAPVVDAVRDRLVQAGLSVVSTLPQITLIVDVADAQGIERAQTIVRQMDVLSVVLPLLALALLLSAILLAHRRWVGGAAILIAASWSMVLLRAGIALGAHMAASHVPSSVASSPAVHSYYAHLTSLLHRGSTIVGVIFALVAVALLVGPAVQALRRGSRPDDERRSARLVAGGLAALALLVWPSPGTVLVALVLVLLLVMVVLIHRIARQGNSAEPGPAPAVVG